VPQWLETRANLLANRIDEKVAAASASVPTAVASEAHVDQSVMLPQLSETARDAGAMDPIHPLPAEVARRLADDLVEVAGAGLVAVYLHGSAVLGGWVPGRSDIDVLIVAADNIDETILASMVDAIVSLQRERPPGQLPAHALETSIVTAAAARDPGPPWQFLRHVVTDPAGRARVVRPDQDRDDRDLLMHYVASRTAGYPAYGPPPGDLIGPIARADILSYLADELRWSVANAPERYGVLNACRARLYLTDGAMVSKIAGGEAALQRGTGPADVIRRALAQQRGSRSDRPPASDAIAFVEATAAMLRDGA
jgi:streptomycin 3"-adenylyltransferase